MGHVTTDDGVSLYYEDAGAGAPIAFVHEFAGDSRSYELQVRHFSKRHRCITYNARGYPPSDVPKDPAKYSQERATADLLAILDHLKIEKAHLVGISMGAITAIEVGLQHPHRVRSLVLGGCGFGADPQKRKRDLKEIRAVIRKIETHGMERHGTDYANSVTRRQFRRKNPTAWATFAERFASHPADGAILVYRGVPMQRPAIYALSEELGRIAFPVLVICGDEDEICLDPSVYLKRTVPTSALAVFPNTSHTVNLEDPDRFNAACDQFLTQVEAGEWPKQEPREAHKDRFGLQQANP